MSDIETINRIKARLMVGHSHPEWQGVNLTAQERAELKQYLLELETENGSLRDHLKRMDIEISEVKQSIRELKEQHEQKRI